MVHRFADTLENLIAGSLIRLITDLAIDANAHLPIGAITATLIRLSTDSVVHRFTDTLETLFARPLIRLIADLPIDANAY